MNLIQNVFEEQLEFYLDDDGNVVIGNLTLSPAAILKGDKVAYDEYYRTWFFEQWLPEKREYLKQLMQIPGNENRYNDLCSAAKRSQLIPFIGSGMSAPNGLPIWSDFLLQIADQIHLDQLVDEIKREVKSGNFEEAVDLLINNNNRFFNERVLHGLRVGNELRGPITYLPYIFENLIITTNLDKVLEGVFLKARKPFSQILIGSDICDYRTRKAEADRFLLKLHGDCEKSIGRVLSSVEYDKVYNDDSQVVQELSLLYQGHNLLFLGSSLHNDRTVRLLARVAAHDSHMPPHYAFIKEPPDTTGKLERQHELTKNGIFPIWYDGDHDEAIEALLLGIITKLGRLELLLDTDE